MKSLVILFVVLVAGFLGAWTYKINTPIDRPNEYAEGYRADAGAWWNSATVSKDEDWKLDPEIPLNYIPVPGEDELYMVVDNNGNIIQYRKRKRQADGTWLWEDVNPDIPENYEPVEGLENVYKVTYEDGTVKYFKYVRNSDDTFAFVEVDENGNEINKNTDASSLDGRHVHISGNVYKRLDENGVAIGYDKRVQLDDGSFVWMDTDLPDYGDSGAGLTDDWGDVGGDLTVPGLDTSAMERAAQRMADANAEAQNGGGNATLNLSYTLPTGGTQTVAPNIIGPEPQIINNPDGTHTEVEVVEETVNIDGITQKKQTYVKKTYDSSGNLISTFASEPVVVDSQGALTVETEPVQAYTGGKLADLHDESVRVTGSYEFETGLASSVFALLNAQRSENGLSPLNATQEASEIAMLRAADMAGYDTSASSLPTYGTLGSMMADYGVSSSVAGENLWKTIERTADEIHTRFQAVENARKTRMEREATSYGIGICKRNGYYYICEVVY